MRKYASYTFSMSSKHAAARGNKELLYLLLQLIEQDEEIKKEYAKKVWQMRSRGYIKRQDGRYALADKGKRALTESKVWSLTIPTPKRWDGKWRVVVFDIPKDKRKRRDSFRRKIQELGLVLYQNSVWVYPYPLEKEIRQLADFYMISNCVSFITADNISGEARLRRQFNL